MLSMDIIFLDYMKGSMVMLQLSTNFEEFQKFVTFYQLAKNVTLVLTNFTKYLGGLQVFPALFPQFVRCCM